MTKFKVGDIVRSKDCLDDKYDEVILCIMMSSKGYTYYIMEYTSGYVIGSSETGFIDKDYVLIGGHNADRTTDTRSA